MAMYIMIHTDQYVLDHFNFQDVFDHIDVEQKGTLTKVGIAKAALSVGPGSWPKEYNSPHGPSRKESIPKVSHHSLLSSSGTCF